MLAARIRNACFRMGTNSFICRFREPDQVETAYAMDKTDRVWVIRPGALGDTLMALPALADLEGRQKIAFVGRQPGLRFIASRAAHIEDFESAGWHRLFMAEPARGGPKDPQAAGVIAFMGEGEGRLRRNLAVLFPGAPVSVFPSVPSAGRPIHVARHVASCLKESGLPVDPERCMESCGRHALLPRGHSAGASRRVVIHPGSGDVRKNFSPAFWMRLIRRLREAGKPVPAEVLVLLGPAEGAIADLFESGLPSRGVGVCYHPRYEQLSEFLGEAALYVGQDSGVTHLAAMLGAPVVALFRSSLPELWRPLGPFVRVIHQKEEHRDLEALVLKAAEEMINGNGG